ncbi:MAG: hypothetical protein ABJF04_07385 [Reichenbachiella sp.]|uniref:hypothetical protein n=1 Tax=Reichenbachiella sp. TaxID=2184521 RepID=UPI0032671399
MGSLVDPSNLDKGVRLALYLFFIHKPEKQALTELINNQYYQLNQRKMRAIMPNYMGEV